MSDYNQSAVLERYGRSPSVDQTRGYLKALKVIIGADGQIPEAELNALKKGMNRMGASEALKQEVLNFDITGVALESVLPNFTQGGTRARMLIRDAIELSSADGTYAVEEKAAVEKAASLLGVDQETVKALQALVEMEHAVKRLRKALL